MAKISIHLSHHVEPVDVSTAIQFAIGMIRPADEWRAAFLWLVDNNIDHYFEAAVDRIPRDYLTYYGDRREGHRTHVWLCLNDKKQAALFKLFFPDLAKYEPSIYQLLGRPDLEEV